MKDKKEKTTRTKIQNYNMRPLHPADISRGPFPVLSFEARKIIKELECKIQDMKNQKLETKPAKSAK